MTLNFDTVDPENLNPNLDLTDGLTEEEISSQTENQDSNQTSENAEKAIAPKVENDDPEIRSFQKKESYWPSCMHLRRTKLHKSSFKDRIAILWACRRCEKRWTENIERDINSRQIYIKSTTTPLQTTKRGPNQND
jgi:hypothetical protein